MRRFKHASFAAALGLVWLCWSGAAAAISLGSPRLFSKAGEPLKVEFPIKLGAGEEGALASLKVSVANKAAFEQLSISKKLLGLNPQAIIFRNKQDTLVVLLETVEPVPVTDDPFLDVVFTVNWSAGSITKTSTLLLGDVQKISVRSGQTLSEIAAQLAPQLDGATIDQTMMALFKANPDAFASGSINRLEAGAELIKPSQALLRSISPAEANQFVAESNAQWQAERSVTGSQSPSMGTAEKTPNSDAKDRLKIGSGVGGNGEDQAYAESLVAQERALEQTRARVAELEKNIADLQRLLDQSKAELKPQDANPIFGLGGFGPALLAIVLMGLTGLALWLLAKNARRAEVHDFSAHAATAHAAAPTQFKAAEVGHTDIPARTKALLAGIDLDLTPPYPATAAPLNLPNPLADALRVKLNLARAYITIEDFSAAKKSLQEIVHVGAAIDPVIALEAQGLLAMLSERNQ